MDSLEGSTALFMITIVGVDIRVPRKIKLFREIYRSHSAKRTMAKQAVAKGVFPRLASMISIVLFEFVRRLTAGGWLSREHSRQW